MQTLTNDMLRTIVPAAFATGPSFNASERYAFISTEAMIDQIRERGWEPVSASQSKKTKDTVHAVHSITFRNLQTTATVNDTLPQMILINSHDLSRRWSLLAGFFRKACGNDLVTSKGIGESRAQRIHLDDANVDVDRALISALTKLEAATTLIEQWQGIELSWSVRQEFARDAIIAKNGGDIYWSKHFNPFEFLITRREQDKANDLWTVFNVVQENIMKGGVQGVTRETRPITQVREVVRINQDLWQLAEKYGKLHGRN